MAEDSFVGPMPPKKVGNSASLINKKEESSSAAGARLCDDMRNAIATAEENLKRIGIVMEEIKPSYLVSVSVEIGKDGKIKTVKINSFPEGFGEAYIKSKVKEEIEKCLKNQLSAGTYKAMYKPDGKNKPNYSLYRTPGTNPDKTPVILLTPEEEKSRDNLIAMGKELREIGNTPTKTYVQSEKTRLENGALLKQVKKEGQETLKKIRDRNSRLAMAGRIEPTNVDTLLAKQKEQPQPLSFPEIKITKEYLDSLPDYNEDEIALPPEAKTLPSRQPRYGGSE